MCENMQYIGYYPPGIEPANLMPAVRIVCQRWGHIRIECEGSDNIIIMRVLRENCDDSMTLGVELVV